jgi:hypothetical protein
MGGDTGDREQEVDRRRVGRIEPESAREALEKILSFCH